MEIKETLLMPKTNFEMRGNLPSKEPAIREKWKRDHLYEELLKKNKKSKFIEFYILSSMYFENNYLHFKTFSVFFRVTRN